MRLILAILSILVFAFVSLGQNLSVPTLSPITEITQEVGLTEVKLVYSRPSAKGRKIFGDLVPFGEIWRTGANASSKLTFLQDVRIEGQALKAGTYALYTIPGPSEWTIIIHNNTQLRSLAGDVYKQENDAFRFKAASFNTSNFVETFTIDFTDISTNSCYLTLSWENTAVKFKISFDVDKQIDDQIAELLKSPETARHQNYFLAAEYYFHNDRDLNKAVSWITAGIGKSPKNPRYGLLHAKILAKQGKKAEALKVIAEANAWARESNNENYTEQTQIFWDSIR